jgi:ADP-heptose:LPS heptosyltransferase
MPRLKKAIKKILIIYWGYVGDILVTTPFLTELRRLFPKADITYIIGGRGKGLAHPARLLEHHPSIDRYIVSDASILHKLFFEKPYDLAIDLCAGRTSRLMTKMSGAPLRLWGKFREIPSMFFYSDSLNPAQPPLEVMIKHNVYKRRNSYRVAPFLEIIQFLGGRAPENPVTEIFIDRREKNYAQKLSKKIKKNSDYVVGIQPGGSIPGRLWPARHYAYLADKLIERRGASVVLFYGPQEKSYVRSVCRHSRHKLFKICEKDIRKYACLISACDLFMTTDGGPLHVALSLGVPSVGIFKTRDIASYWYNYKNRKGLFSALVKKDERGLVLKRAEEALLSRTR